MMTFVLTLAKYAPIGARRTECALAASATATPTPPSPTQVRTAQLQLAPLPILITMQLHLPVWAHARPATTSILRPVLACPVPPPATSAETNPPSAHLVNPLPPIPSTSTRQPTLV